MRVFTSPSDIISAVGDELGISDWVTVTQDQVNTFADATGDHQWIHVDVERASRESPFGGPIAHGYLSLSLLPMLGWQVYAVEGAKIGINYGSNKVRFPSPVPVGAQVRLRTTLKSAEELPDGAVQMVMSQLLEIKDHPKPAVVAETVSRVAY
jgi:acyl dehydratase